MEDSSGVKRGPGPQKLDRRGFLKLAGGAVTGGVAGALLSRTGLAAPAANAAGSKCSTYPFLEYTGILGSQRMPASTVRRDVAFHAS